MRVDVHQHIWTESLVEALRARRSPPFLTRDGSRLVLHSPGEAPYEIDPVAEAPKRRLALLEEDGLDAAVVAISSPIGMEALPREEAELLLDAHLAGVEMLGPRFAVWGPLCLDPADPDDVDRVLARGCVGVSVPAGALASPEQLEAVAAVLARAATHSAPVFVHPGPAPGERSEDPQPNDPGWWVPMTRYVSQMQSAWLSFAAFGRRRHPRLALVFAMLAGGAPLLHERLLARGGPTIDLHDPLVFYDTSSFGPAAIDAMAGQVGEGQLVYGSDRPVVEPTENPSAARLQENGARLLSAGAHGP